MDDAVNVAVWPAFTAVSAGLLVTTGAVPTVSVAAVVVAVPTLFMKTARNWLPVSPLVVVSLYVVLVAPSMLVQLPAPLFTCHCTDGAGLPVAAAVNSTVLPTVTACVTGLVTTLGASFTVTKAAVVIASPKLLVKIAW